MSKNIIGIDLGTTNSVVAIVQDGHPQVLSKGNEKLIPSVVGYNSEKAQWLIGTPARNQQLVEPDNTVASIKRKMGQTVTVTLEDKTFTPPQVSALILGEMKRIADTAVGESITDAVITVPAYFTDSQRQATKEAGELAGLNVLRIINEPTSAALAYGLQDETDRLALVYDLGGGTFDVSLVELMGGVVEVLASHGDTQLGGDDFDLRLAEWVNAQFEEEHGVDLRQDSWAWTRLIRAAEQAKKELSFQPYTTLKEPFIIEKEGVPLHVELEIEREVFVGLIEDLLDKTIESIDQVIEDAEVDVDDLDMILLVGGSTRMPIVSSMLEDMYGLLPQSAINPDEAVALGAAVQGAIIAGAPIEAVLVDVTPHSLGIEIATFTFGGHLRDDIYRKLIPRNTTIPTSREERFYTMYEGQDKVNVKVYQGEHPVASKNTLLGDFMVSGLAETGELYVKFDFDLNGILQVTGRDKTRDQEVSIAVDVVKSQLGDVDLLAVQSFFEEEWDEDEHDDGEALPEVGISPTLLAAITQAEKRLTTAEDNSLDTAVQQRLIDLLGQIEAAQRVRDEEAIETLEEQLLDVLFDLE